MQGQDLGWSIHGERWLAEGVEFGHLSSSSASQIANHLDLHGLPQTLEAAYAIPGLSEAELSWVMGSPQWLHWTTMPPLPRQTSNLRFTCRHQVNQLEGGPHTKGRSWLRAQGHGLKVQVELNDSLSLAGSWSWRHAGTNLVLGAHQLMWGHGLTIPRTEPFAGSWYRGGAEMRLASNPVGLHTNGWSGAQSGVAWMQAHRRGGLGCSVSRHHWATWIQSDAGRMKLSTTTFMNAERLALGVEGRWVEGTWDVEWAHAHERVDSTWESLQRVAVRRAFSPQVLWQGVAWREGESWEVNWFWTWRNPSRRSTLQCQIQGAREPEKPTDWSMRWMFEPSRSSSWKLRGLMDNQGHESSVRLKWGGWQWDGGLRRGVDGWSRGVGCSFRGGSRKSVQWGWAWMDAEGQGLRSRVMWSSLDGVQWMTHREEGGRLMGWVQGKIDSNWRVGTRLIWQASQQSTFRFEFQATWER